ncbi:alpha/beta fold hydrolase [Pseudonocardia sp. WMMC193]|uniref:alpha/beta fold hydrolase n=1 Tax=Pseudonocardia sp. WMMC193 TaxID=2911965 RepID=UPI001F38C032|nr:alpha/beta fold hydrolase [Pseudonocardia sp. WMMC193]MCF7552293.1 alpha/beta hydrolase [Pseudonocardia sp. WMMC193]
MSRCRLSAVASLLVAALTVAACSSGAAVEAPPAAQAATPTLSWTDCGDGFQCTTIEVPRDWDDPDGPTISLGMTKLPAPGARAGAVFVNWGGPGDPGTSSIRTRAQTIVDATGGTMDIVSWDPRGLATSTPIRCPEGNMRYFEADPGTTEGLRSAVGAVQERAAACTARYGDYLDLLGTVQGVKDLEAMRIATGEPVLNFLGLSYGTRVGATYAALFPGTVGNMVLDGSMSQKGTVRDTAFGMARAGQDSLDRWFARCAAKPDCAFGPDPGAGYDEMFAKVRAEQPVVPGTDGAHLTAGLLYQVVLAGLVDYGGSQEVAEQAIAQYRTTGDPSTLYAVGVGIAGQRPDGTFSNGPEIFQYVGCADWPTRLTFDELTADAAQAALISPRIGAFAATFALIPATACPQAKEGPLPLPTAPVAGTVLIMGNISDAETPLENGEELRSLIPGSRLMVLETMGHTGFYRSPCLAAAGGAALTRGELPPDGTRCAA